MMKWSNTKRVFYALARWGGHVGGQKPRTALFAIYKQAHDGERKWFKGIRVDPQAQRELTKSFTNIWAGDCFQSWSYFPSTATLRQARAELRVEPCRTLAHDFDGNQDEDAVCIICGSPLLDVGVSHG